MYEERKNKFSLRDIILQLLLIVLFIFIMVWLFPTKNYLKDQNVVENDAIYVDYMNSMSDAAKDYFTTKTVPSKVGDTVKLTLGEMLEKKIILPIGGNASCSLEKSYIEVTKMDDDYQLRVELSCEKFSDYVIITLGCKDFCNLTCTETVVTPKPTQPTQQSTKKYTVTFDSNGGTSVASQKVESGKKATKPADPTKEGYTFVEWTLDSKTYDFNAAVTKNITLVAVWKENKVVQYEYSKEIPKTSSEYVWSNWSATQIVWEKNKTFVNTDDKEYKIVSTGLTKFNGKYNCEKNVVLDKQVAEIKKDRVYADIIPAKEAEYSEWKVVEAEYVSDVPLKQYNTSADTATERYEFIRTQVKSLCSGCAQTTVYVYKYSTRTLTEGTPATCPKEYTMSSDGKRCYKIVEKYSCEKYGDDYTMTSDNYCVKKGEKCTKKLEDYTEYQYRTRKLETINSVDVDYKWSTSNNDADLLAQDYKLTGNTK